MDLTSKQSRSQLLEAFLLTNRAAFADAPELDLLNKLVELLRTPYVTKYDVTYTVAAHVDLNGQDWLSEEFRKRAEAKTAQPTDDSGEQIL